MTHVKEYKGLMEPSLAQFSEISVMRLKPNNMVHACTSVHTSTFPTHKRVCGDGTTKQAVVWQWNGAEGSEVGGGWGVRIGRYFLLTQATHASSSNKCKYFMTPNPTNS